MRAWTIVAASVLLLSCDGEPEGPVGAACQFDSDCEGGRLCFEEACVPTDRLTCVTGESKAPTIQAHPDALRYDAPSTESLIIKNGGTCTLSIPAVRIEGVNADRFTCATCADGLPLEVYPGRTQNLEVTLSAGPPGALDATLVLSTNDPQQADLRVPLLATSAGEPKMTVTETTLEFGYVPNNRHHERGVQVLNTGTGTAELSVTELIIDPAGPFSLIGAPPTPAMVEPVDHTPTAGLALTVRYAPTAAASDRTATLTIRATGQADVQVALEASDVAPDASIAPASIDFGTVMLGRAVGRRITIQNTGQAGLRAVRRWDRGPPTDLLLPRALPPEIRAGGVGELDVSFQPTVAGSVQNVVVIESNDPNNQTVRVPVVGLAVASPEEVVSVEMTFDNDSSTVLDHDLRNVDLSLENPLGQIVNERLPTGAWNAKGSATWSAPPSGEPERLVLTEVTEDGTYLVKVSYTEDCATLPTALAAMLLGIGTDVLVDELSEGEVMLDADDLGRVVEQICAERRAVNAQVKVRIDGVLKADERVRLENKGLTQNALQLVRQNGRFMVLPP